MSFRIDHHIHTTRHSPDSVMTPEELLERAREIGLDGVVITEHDQLWDADELAALSSKAPELTVLSGVEVSTMEGHFLVYGLTDLDECPPGVPLLDLIEIVEDQNAAIVAAHPYRWEQNFDAILDEFAESIDALERASNNVLPDMRHKIDQALATYPSIGATGSSDAHETAVLGCYFTEFDMPIRSMADFVKGLKERRGQPRHRPGAWLVAGPLA